jgi:hypothetical protein
VVVGDDELDAVEAVAAQSEQEVLPGGAAGRLAKASRLSSRRLLMAETAEAEKAWPQSFLGDRLDPRVKPEGRLLRVETPCTYISASVANTCSERWWRSKSSVENRPSRSPRPTIANPRRSAGNRITSS